MKEIKLIHALTDMDERGNVKTKKIPLKNKARMVDPFGVKWNAKISALCLSPS